MPCVMPLRLRLRFNAAVLVAAVVARQSHCTQPEVDSTLHSLTESLGIDKPTSSRNDAFVICSSLRRCPVLGSHQCRDSKHRSRHNIPDLLHSLSTLEIPTKRGVKLRRSARYLRLGGKDAIPGGSGCEQAYPSGLWSASYDLERLVSLP